MGVSRTSNSRKKNLNKKLLTRAERQAAAETVVEIMARLLERWGSKELDRLCSTKDFICLEVGKDVYRVGQFELRKQAETCWTVASIDGVHIHDFFNRQAAVFYCLYETRNNFVKAKEFLHSDAELGKSYSELNNLNKQLARALKQKDFFKADLYSARISNVKPQLEHLETNLQKSIIAAKYNKVWDTKS